MPSSSSDGSRKRPRVESENEDEASPTKRAASMEKSLNETDGVGVMSTVNDEIDAYMLEQDDPIDHQAPNGLHPSPQPAPPPIMPRVQTVPIREKWDAIGLLLFLSVSPICSLMLISNPPLSRYTQVHVFKGRRHLVSHLCPLAPTVENRV
jgi:hypothetical protein